ncbi:MAG: 23S rRNA (uracil(1939)-C(5))-methyltransferase RlmD [Elusimicrobiaceae bacterium]
MQNKKDTSFRGRNQQSEPQENFRFYKGEQKPAREAVVREPVKEQGEIFRVKAQRFTTGGLAICETEHGNKHVLVPYAAVGDILDVRITGKNSKGIFEGVITGIVQHGHGRKEPVCPIHFTPGKTLWCGGCDMGHLDYPDQLKAKGQIVDECLKKAGIYGIDVRKPIPSPVDKRYRNKSQIPVVNKGDRTFTGFYHPGSHHVVPFEDCIVQPKLTITILKVLRDIITRMGWSTCDPVTGFGWLKHIFIRTNSKSQAMVVLVASGETAPGLEKAVSKLVHAVPEIVSVYINVQKKRTPVVLGHEWKKLYGDSLMTENLGNLNFMFYPGSFLQVNNRAAEVLFKTALDFLAMGERTPYLYDIYCGAGAIGLLAADRFEWVIGIEENQGAVACAYKNAEKNHIKNASFVAGKAEKVFAADIYGKLNRTASVVIDPPRQGCESSLLIRLKHPSIRNIVYVSCNPETFARDANVLISCGFKLHTVQPVDMFPQTAHIELVAFFDRANTGPERHTGTHTKKGKF